MYTESRDLPIQALQLLSKLQLILYASSGDNLEITRGSMKASTKNTSLNVPRTQWGGVPTSLCTFVGDNILLWNIPALVWQLYFGLQLWRKWKILSTLTKWIKEMASLLPLCGTNGQLSHTSSLLSPHSPIPASSHLAMHVQTTALDVFAVRIYNRLEFGVENGSLRS